MENRIPLYFIIFYIISLFLLFFFKLHSCMLLGYVNMNLYVKRLLLPKQLIALCAPACRIVVVLKLNLQQHNIMES